MYDAQGPRYKIEDTTSYSTQRIGYTGDADCAGIISHKTVWRGVLILIQFINAPSQRLFRVSTESNHVSYGPRDEEPRHRLSGLSLDATAWGATTYFNSIKTLTEDP
jgi:hypothetical protein